MNSPSDRAHDPARWSFLIPAAGPGDRLGKGPKCLLTLGRETLWQRAVRRAIRIADDVVLAVPAECVADIRGAAPACRVIAGGASRQETIATLLAAASRDRILIHDVARPFGSRQLMLAVAALGDRTGAAACLSECDSPVVRAPDGVLAEVSSLPSAGMAESPLALHRQVLEEAYRRSGATGHVARSTVELVWQSGHPVRFIASERDNIKITLPGDWELARMIVAAWDARHDAAD